MSVSGEDGAPPRPLLGPSDLDALATHRDTALLAERLRTVPDLVRERFDVHSSEGWTAAGVTLRLNAETDEVIAATLPVVRDLVARGFLEPVIEL